MATSDAIRGGEPGLRYFAPSREAVFIGLLRAHAELTRTLDQELSRRHGLGLSAYELLSRLCLAPEAGLRMSVLAEQTGLSLSRVSRLIDQLSRIGLAHRQACDPDSRVVHAVISAEGRQRVQEAQDTFFAVVEDQFLGRLSCEEVDTLGALLGRLREPQPAGA